MNLVTSLKTIFVSACLVSACSTPALAVMFRGEITSTITQTNNPDYVVGQCFTGFYEYDAPVRDGVFFANYPAAPSANQSLDGCVGLPSGPGRDSELLFFFGPERGSYPIYLVMTDGLVTGFNWSIESVANSVPDYPYLRLFGKITANTFRFEQTSTYQDGNGATQNVDFISLGTVTFSAPCTVPDLDRHFNTAGLLAISFLGGFMLFRKRLTKLSSTPKSIP